MGSVRSVPQDVRHRQGVRLCFLAGVGRVQRHPGGIHSGALVSWGPSSSDSGSEKDWRDARKARAKQGKKSGGRDKQKKDDDGCGLTVVLGLGTVSGLALLVQEGLTHLG
jgi:hypothetical protein